MKPAVVIVGAGQAGVQVAVSLREMGCTGPITLLGDEPTEPYQRPPLSKAYLAGASAESLALRSSSFYAREHIDVLSGERVVATDLDTESVSTDRGRTLRFTQLVLTTGARVRRLGVPGAHQLGVHYLRDLSEASALAADMRDATNVVVIGGGFIGLEVASAARKAGKNVTVIESSGRLLGRAVAPVVSDFYLAAHRRRGTTVQLGRQVVAIEGLNGSVTGIQLDGGERIPADLVVVGIGVVPRTELAEQLGLDIRGGVVVDDQARTSDPRVLAAGDVTSRPHPRLSDRLIRLESVQNAMGQARAAAATILEHTLPPQETPWFWSDQDDLKLQIAGISDGYDCVVVRGDPTTERYSALYFADERLIAADCVNRPQEFVAVRRALTAGQTLAPDRAADTTRPLRDLLRSTG